MVAGADPVVIRGGIIGLVVGISGGIVQLTSLRVLASGLSVESSSGLAVQGLEHLQQRNVLTSRRDGTLEILNARISNIGKNKP